MEDDSQFKRIHEASEEHDKIIRRSDANKRMESELSRLEERRYRSFLDEKVRPALLSFKEKLEKEGHSCDIKDDRSGIDFNVHLANLRNQYEGQFPKLSIYRFQSPDIRFHGTLRASENYAGEISVFDDVVSPSEINENLVKKYIVKLIVEAYKDPEEFANL